VSAQLRRRSNQRGERSTHQGGRFGRVATLHYFHDRVLLRKYRRNKGGGKSTPTTRNVSALRDANLLVYALLPKGPRSGQNRFDGFAVLWKQIRCGCGQGVPSVYSPSPSGGFAQILKIERGIDDFIPLKIQ
jgi:hypothetical protein